MKEDPITGLSYWLSQEPRDNALMESKKTRGNGMEAPAGPGTVHERELAEGLSFPGPSLFPVKLSVSLGHQRGRG